MIAVARNKSIESLEDRLAKVVTKIVKSTGIHLEVVGNRRKRMHETSAKRAMVTCTEAIIDFNHKVVVQTTRIEDGMHADSEMARDSSGQ